jgi:hypothetical protein
MADEMGPVAQQATDPFDAALAELQRLLADGGDLSGPSARRLPAERAQPPKGTSLVGAPQEDIEARAWAPRTGLEPIPFGNVLAGGTALVASPFKAARDFVHGLRESVERLGRQGYHPEIDDEQYKRQAAADAFNVAGAIGSTTFGAANALADTGSLGTFIGKVGGKGLAEASRPTALKAIAEAERLEGLGLPQDVIRLEVNKLIRVEDPALGGVWRGDDGKWRVEISDRDNRVRKVGPPISKLGREYTAPELYQAYPDLPDVTYMRTPGARGSYHKPGDPSEIGIGEKSSSPRRSVAEEVGHEIDLIEDFARGGSPDDFRPGGPLAHLLQPGETPLQGYRRLSSEIEKQIVKARIDMTPKELRNTPPWETRAMMQTKYPSLVPDGPVIIGPSERNPLSRSIGRNPLDPEELSAFEQAQEGHWNDLAQRGEALQQPSYTERPSSSTGQPRGGRGPASSDLWSREANLELAKLHKQSDWPADIAPKLSDRFGRTYSEDKVASQLEKLGLVESSRKLPRTSEGEWQPDALQLLQSERARGLSAAQLAHLIEQETGQVTTKGAVIGKLDRLRSEKARADLAEDLARPEWASEAPSHIKLPKDTYWDAKLNQPRHKEGTFVDVP